MFPTNRKLHCVRRAKYHTYAFSRASARRAHSIIAMCTAKYIDVLLDSLKATLALVPWKIHSAFHIMSWWSKRGAFCVHFYCTCFDRVKCKSRETDFKQQAATAVFWQHLEQAHLAIQRTSADSRFGKFFLCHWLQSETMNKCCFLHYLSINWCSERFKFINLSQLFIRKSIYTHICDIRMHISPYSRTFKLFQIQLKVFTQIAKRRSVLLKKQHKVMPWIFFQVYVWTWHSNSK